MEGFVYDNVDARQEEPDIETPVPLPPEGIHQAYHGFAAVFQRVARSVEGTGDRRDLETLKSFAEDASKSVTDWYVI